MAGEDDIIIANYLWYLVGLDTILWAPNVSSMEPNRTRMKSACRSESTFPLHALAYRFAQHLARGEVDTRESVTFYRFATFRFEVFWTGMQSSISGQAL
jgi:hypothetical protein